MSQSDTMTPSIDQRAREAAERFRISVPLRIMWDHDSVVDERLIELFSDYLTAQHTEDVAAGEKDAEDKRAERAPIELAATQATIAELNKQLNYVVSVTQDKQKGWEACEYSRAIIEGEHDQLRTENAALRSERDEIESHKETLIRCAERLSALPDDGPESKMVEIFEAMIEETKDREISDLRAQLATAIAERDEARQELSKTNKVATIYANSEGCLADKLASALAEIDSVRECGNRITSQLKKERDSALAACTAKDVALRSAQSFIDLYSGPTHEVLKVIDAALSPAAGIDYVPKAPMVELYDCVHIHLREGGISERFATAINVSAKILTTDSL